VQLAPALLSRAKQGDKEAITVMFRQFIDPAETIHSVEYLGRRGLITGHHSFGCLAERRVASIEVGSFGRMIYQDGYLEDINSSVFYQPSLLRLYVLILFFIGATLFIARAVSQQPETESLTTWVYLLGALLVFYSPTLYYRSVKSGLVFVVQQGVSVYMFTNRAKLARANALWRAAASFRDARLRFPHSG
jgi:hypothetical protein